MDSKTPRWRKKAVWVKGYIPGHHKTLKGGSSKSLYVEFLAEDGSREGLWCRASNVRWFAAATREGGQER